VTLQQQIEFGGELELLFLKKDNQFSQFADYDGEYRVWADKMAAILESLWRLQELEH
jgi:hypothetical protein